MAFGSAWSLMAEVAYASCQQHHTVLIAHINGLLIAHAASRVDDGRHPSLACNLHTVSTGERKECITCKDRTLHGQCITLKIRRSNAKMYCGPKFGSST